MVKLDELALADRFRHAIRIAATGNQSQLRVSWRECVPRRASLVRAASSPARYESHDHAARSIRSRAQPNSQAAAPCADFSRHVVVVSIVASIDRSPAPRRPERRRTRGRRSGAGHVSVLHVRSADHDIPVRDVEVYRPDVPDSRTLPVVYFLHGLPGSASDLFASGAVAVLDHMFETGTPPFVVACPTGTGHAHNDTEWADSVDGRDLLESYIIESGHRRGRGLASARRRAPASSPASRWAVTAPRTSRSGTRAPSRPRRRSRVLPHRRSRPRVRGQSRRRGLPTIPSILIRTVRSVRFWLADGTSDREPVVQGEARAIRQCGGTPRWSERPRPRARRPQLVVRRRTSSRSRGVRRPDRRQAAARAILAAALGLYACAAPVDRPTSGSAPGPRVRARRGRGPSARGRSRPAGWSGCAAASWRRRPPACGRR